MNQEKTSIRELLKQTAQAKPDSMKKQNIEQEIASLQAQLKLEEYRGERLRFKTRHHRLCTRGAMLECFFDDPVTVSNEEIRQMLFAGFNTPEIQATLARMIAQAKADICADK